jgi:putative transposase
MKVVRRTVQRGGHLQFENILYRGEYLAGYAGEIVNLRYDPRDITTVWVYRQEKDQEVFLTRAHAQGLETEQLPVAEAQSSAKRLRDQGKTVSNQAILQEVIEREALVDSKKNRKQRQKEEQTYKQSKPITFIAEVETETQQLTEVDVNSKSADIEIWDDDEMREDLGW